MRPLHDAFTPTVDPTQLLGLDLAFRGAPSAEILATQLERAHVDRRLLQSLVGFQPNRYFRKVLWRTPQCELVLACWMPGQGSAIHDHGGCEGATLLVTGSLEERRFEEREGGLLYRGSGEVRSGQILLEHDNSIHQIHNPAAQAAVSLHLYAPPLMQFQQYSEQSSVL
jgi:cysteine dioxygenase